MAGKICSKCKRLLALSEFKLRGDKTGPRSMCKACVKEYDKDRYFANHEYNLVHRKVNRKRIYDRNKTFVKGFLEDKCCVVCGESDNIVLEFHHRDPSLKEQAITEMMTRSIESIAKEMLKCDVLCANCHRRLHYYKRLEE